MIKKISLCFLVLLVPSIHANADEFDNQSEHLRQLLTEAVQSEAHEQTKEACTEADEQKKSDALSRPKPVKSEPILNSELAHEQEQPIKKKILSYTEFEEKLTQGTLDLTAYEVNKEELMKAAQNEITLKEQQSKQSFWLGLGSLGAAALGAALAAAGFYQGAPDLLITGLCSGAGLLSISAVLGSSRGKLKAQKEKHIVIKKLIETTVPD